MEAELFADEKQDEHEPRLAEDQPLALQQKKRRLHGAVMVFGIMDWWFSREQRSFQPGERYRWL